MKVLPQRRADEFARLLETKGRTDDPVAAPLLTVVDALTEVPGVPGPRPEFRAALRQRLVAVAAVQAAAPAVDRPLDRVKAASTTWRVQRRMVAVGAGAAVVTAVAGVGVGASRSVPGEPFYGVKRATEGVQLATTFGTEDRGKRHLQFARERLSEVTALSTDSSSSLGPVTGGQYLAAAAVTDRSTVGMMLDTLHDMDVETRSGANDLFVAYRDSGSTEPLKALNHFTVMQYAELKRLMGALPASVRPRAMSSLALLNLVSADTISLARTARATPPGEVTPSPTSSRPPSSPPRSSSPGPHPSSPSSSKSSGVTVPTGGPTVPLPVPSAVVPSIPTTPPTLGPLPTSVPTLDVNGLLGGH